VFVACGSLSEFKAFVVLLVSLRCCHRSSSSGISLDHL
jgi:hypothetical protein